MILIDRKKTLSAKFRTAGSSGRKLHVISTNGNWVIFREGSEKIISKFSNRREAILNGKKILKSENSNVLVVHKPDGSVEKLQKAN